MIENSYKVFRDLVVFVNTICRFNDNFNLNKFNNAIKTTDFKNLQDLEEKGKFTENVYSRHDNRKIKFFNQGPNNDWKKNLSKDLIEKMNKFYKNDLKKFNYEY